MEFLKAKEVNKMIFNNAEVKQVNPKTFYNSFCKSVETLKNKELVDVHNLNDYRNTYNFLSADKKSGFAVTKNGDLISVFNNSNCKGFLKSIANFVKSNVKTLDCYQSKQMDLSKVYSKVFNFKIASILQFDYDFLVAEKGKEYADNFVKIHGKSNVAFMVNTTKEVNTKYFTDYGMAINYRDSYC